MTMFIQRINRTV